VSATVIPLRPDAKDTADRVLGAFHEHLDRCALADTTKRAYRRQSTAYIRWLAQNTGRHPDAFTDTVGAEAAVDSWRKHLLTSKQKPASVNQALAAIVLMYQQGTHLRLDIKRARVDKPGAPDALTPNQTAAVQRAADRRAPRDSAIIAVLLGTGARVEECARLDIEDVPITSRTGTARLLGKGHQVRTLPLPPGARERVAAWLAVRPAGGKALWVGQRGALTIEGITKVVLTVGQAAGIVGLRPHDLRHTFATRLREGGADAAQIQKLMGHVSIETTQRYFRASDEEVAELVARIFG
jgi:site-specific recombinase XerD